MSSFDTTKMEFVKVQDMNNYKLDQIEYQGINNIEIDQSVISCEAQTVTGRVIMQSGEGWVVGDVITGTDEDGNRHYIDPYDNMSPTRGTGQMVTEFTLSVPANTGDTNITWRVGIEDDFDKWYRAEFVQETCNTAATLTLSPTAQTVSANATSATFTAIMRRASNLAVSGTDSWARPTLNGTTITVQLDANTGSQRTTTIVATATGNNGENLRYAAPLTQAGIGPIETDVDELTLEYTQAPDVVEVITDDTWTGTITDNQ